MVIDYESNRELNPAAEKYHLAHLLDINSSTEGF